MRAQAPGERDEGLGSGLALRRGAVGAMPGLPRMCWHAFWAELNAGWPEIEGLIPMATEVPSAEVVTFGSGKLVTP